MAAACNGETLAIARWGERAGICGDSEISLANGSDSGSLCRMRKPFQRRDDRFRVHPLAKFDVDLFAPSPARRFPR
jgi:hypothetical protein